VAINELLGLRTGAIIVRQIVRDGRPIDMIVDTDSRKVVSVMQRMRRQENTGSGN
jgi:hypothetical protein